VPFLIDGDNLLGTWPGRRRSDAERRALVRELDRFAARERRRVVVVFDGVPPPGLVPGPDVHFAGGGRTADDVILARVRREPDPRGWTVVTSDRSLGDRCRHARARVERSDRFRTRLRARKSDEKPEREDDVDYWLRQFGNGD
jgi:predicted RNA-binding protein with PIN domain